MRVPILIHIHVCFRPQILPDLWTREHRLTGQDFDNLMLICEYVVAIYLKQRFRIKNYQKVTDGAPHLLEQKLIKLRL